MNAVETWGTGQTLGILERYSALSTCNSNVTEVLHQFDMRSESVQIVLDSWVKFEGSKGSKLEPKNFLHSLAGPFLIVGSLISLVADSAGSFFTARVITVIILSSEFKRISITSSSTCAMFPRMAQLVLI